MTDFFTQENIAKHRDNISKHHIRGTANPFGIKVLDHFIDSKFIKSQLTFGVFAFTVALTITKFACKMEGEKATFWAGVATACLFVGLLAIFAVDYSIRKLKDDTKATAFEDALKDINCVEAALTAGIFALKNATIEKLNNHTENITKE